MWVEREGEVLLQRRFSIRTGLRQHVSTRMLRGSAQLAAVRSAAEDGGRLCGAN